MRWLLVAWLVLSAAARAMPGYEPLADAARVPLRACPNSSGAWQHQSLGCRGWQVQRVEPDTQNPFLPEGLVEYNLFHHATLKTRFRYLPQGSAAGGFNLWTGNLNRDHQIDFVIAEHSGGNGLAAWMDTVTLVLSSRTGYQSVTFFSFGFTPRDLLRWHGQVYLVSTQAIGGASWDDRSDRAHHHTYWVHSFLRLEPQGLQMQWTRAPIWIRYTFAPNHRAETKTRVSEAQRQRLWREQAHPVFVPHQPLN